MLAQRSEEHSHRVDLHWLMWQSDQGPARLLKP
jgi:hypothetical protein